MICDRNPSLGLVLDDTLYRPIADIDRGVALPECDRTYLKQRHYVARSVTVGLAIGSAPLADGWEQMEGTAWMDKLKRG